MNLSTDDLLLLIGAKEAELYALRRRVAELEALLEQKVEQVQKEMVGASE